MKAIPKQRGGPGRARALGPRTAPSAVPTGYNGTRRTNPLPTASHARPAELRAKEPSPMLIDRVARQLLSVPEMEPLLRELSSGSDASLAVAQSARPLVLAALWARDPRPCVLVVSGEEAADRTARALAAWLGQDVVARYPERKDRPWSDAQPDDAVIGARCRAMARLSAGERCLVVASAHSLLRRVPPVGSGYFASSTFSVGDEVPFDEVPDLLVGMGYADAGDAGSVDAPGAFHVHGDAVDVFPAQATSPVRIEFFGDELDRVRRMVASTGQTIG